jgi:hypothetical protein
MPKRVYAGQNFTNEVNTSNPATTNPTNPGVPVSTFVKYNMSNTPATVSRIPLSTVPTLAFMVIFFQK